MLRIKSLLQPHNLLICLLSISLSGCGGLSAMATGMREASLSLDVREQCNVEILKKYPSFKTENWDPGSVLRLVIRERRSYEDQPEERRKVCYWKQGTFDNPLPRKVCTTIGPEDRYNADSIKAAVAKKVLEGLLGQPPSQADSTYSCEPRYVPLNNRPVQEMLRSCMTKTCTDLRAEMGEEAWYPSSKRECKAVGPITEVIKPEYAYEYEGQCPGWNPFTGGGNPGGADSKLDTCINFGMTLNVVYPLDGNVYCKFNADGTFESTDQPVEVIEEGLNCSPAAARRYGWGWCSD